jgi:hypothetical protein
MGETSTRPAQDQGVLSGFNCPVPLFSGFIAESGYGSAKLQLADIIGHDEGLFPMPG